MSQKIYKMTEDGFEPIGYEWTGFPADGVWLVKDGTQNLVEPLEKYNQNPNLNLDYKLLVEELTTFLGQKRNKVHDHCSFKDIAEWSAEFFTNKAEEQVGKELFFQD